MSMEEKQNSLISQDSDVVYPKKEKEVSDIIKKFYKSNIPIEIIGSGSKRLIGKPLQCGKTLNLSMLDGIIEYKPEELYIKVKAGTPIREIKAELDKHNQQLAFEPNDFGPLFKGNHDEGSIGGVVSCNFSGPRRFKVGSARDHILGFQGINGRGETIKSGGTVVKNVTGYDLSKILSGSFGTLTVLTEISIKVLPKSESSKTLVIKNPHLLKALDYLNISLSSSSDPSGGAFYPEYFTNHFTFNDLTHEGPFTAIRIEGPKESIDHRIKNLCKELELNINENLVLENEQSKILWERTRTLEVFSKMKSNLLRIVVPSTETFEVIKQLRPYEPEYLIDWGGSLIWLQLDKISTRILNEIRKIVNNANGYLTVIKIEEDLKASVDIFTIDPVKYKISEKLKKSFDPKRILNPGKMYSGI